MSVIDNLHISASHVFCIMRLNIHLTKTIVKILTPEISKEFQLIISANLYSRIPPIKLHQTVTFIKSLGHILLHVQKEDCNHEYTRDTNFNVETQVGKKPRWHGGQIHYMKSLHVGDYNDSSTHDKPLHKCSRQYLLGDNMTKSYFVSEDKFILPCP